MPPQQTQGEQIRGRNDGELVTVTQDGSKFRLDVSTGQSALPGFSIPPFDKIVAAYPTTTREVYQYYLAGVLLNTITVDYTDTTKNYVSQAVKT